MTATTRQGPVAIPAFSIMKEGPDNHREDTIRRFLAAMKEEELDLELDTDQHPQHYRIIPEGTHVLRASLIHGFMTVPPTPA